MSWVFPSNTLSVENAVNISNKLNIPIVYISTAGIFDGSKDVFDDWDQPNPMCHYARSKYAAERFVLEHASCPLVLRAGWMMGGGQKKDKKFVSKILNQIIKQNRLTDFETVRLVNSIKQIENALFTKEPLLNDALNNILKEIKDNVGTVPENIASQLNAQSNTDPIWDKARHFLAKHNG